MVGQLLALLLTDDSIWKVGFIGYEYFDYVFAGMGLDLFQPVLNIVVGVLLRAVIHEDDAHSSLVVCLGDGAEALLSRRVPHLQFHTLPLNIHRFYLKVNPYTGYKSRGLPMVGMWVKGMLPSEKRSRMHDFPT